MVGDPYCNGWQLWHEYCFLRLVKGPRGNEFSGKKKIFDRMISFVFSLREGG